MLKIGWTGISPKSITGFLIWCAFLTAAGCPGDDEPAGGGGGGTFSTQVQPIFTTRCAVSGCHVSGGIAPMSLVAGVSYANLVNVPVTDGNCGSQVRVEPGNASQSELYRRVSGMSQCSRMPFNPIPGADTLTTGDQNIIRDWINGGALEN